MCVNLPISILPDLEKCTLFLRICYRNRTNTTGSRMANGLAWFREEDWSTLLKSANDADALHDTYEQWQEDATKKFDELRSKGVRVQKVDINVEELIHWCRDQKIPLNGASRSRFAANKLRQK